MCSPRVVPRSPESQPQISNTRNSSAFGVSCVCTRLVSRMKVFGGSFARARAPTYHKTKMCAHRREISSRYSVCGLPFATGSIATTCALCSPSLLLLLLVWLLPPAGIKIICRFVYFSSCDLFILLRYA